MCVCNICNNNLEILNINKTKYLYCKTCECLYKIKLPSSKEEYDRYLYHNVDDNYKDYMNNIFLKIKDFLNDGISLDFGCGKEKTLETIFKNNNLKMYSYDKYFIDFNYSNYKYDNIILNEVFEHIKNPYDLLKELILLLNDKGRIIIGTNLHKNNFNNWWYLRDITHITFYSKKTMEVLSKRLNLKIIYNFNNLIVLEYSKNDLCL